MKNKSKGIIFYSKNIKDNDLYIKILSSKDEINSGLVFGGNSSKKKLIYQKGYFIEYSSIKKNQNSPSILTAEINKPYIGNILEDKYKINALLSILSLINLSIVEGQNINGLFKDLEYTVIKIVDKKNWIIIYCEWLFSLLQRIGYQIDYHMHFDKKYFNLHSQVFTNNFSKESLEFPHDLFSIKKIINFKNLDTIFSIFESIFTINHLDNLNYKMPFNFINFKKMILLRLKL